MRARISVCGPLSCSVSWQFLLQVSQALRRPVIGKAMRQEVVGLATVE
jgi:hypothetical protein